MGKLKHKFIKPKKKEEKEKNDDKNVFKKKTQRINLEEVEDDIDTFSKQNNMVQFEGNESEEEDENIDSVYDLDVGDSEEEEEELEEDEEEEDYRKMKKSMRKGQEDGEKEDLEDMDKSNLLTSEWGSTKQNYYKSDYIESDRRAAKEEEVEAKRLQQKKAQLLSTEDFNEPETLEQLQKGKKTEKSKMEEENSTSILQSINKDLDSVTFDDGVEVETLKKNVSGLTQQEKLDIIMNESPELLALIDDFKKKISDIRSKVHPIYEKVKNGELPTTKGVSFLEVKFHLMLSYCINIGFYLLLKAEGKQVKDHPVIDQLVKIRTLIEKLKPIDQKLKYQVDKLLKILATGDLEYLKNDPRTFKPKPQEMMVEEDEEGEDEENKVYTIPKFSEAEFVDKLSKQEKKREQTKKRALQGEMMDLVRDMYGDEPEEISHSTDTRDKKTRERELFEEDNFIRLALSKKDRKKEQMQDVKDDTLENLTKFEDFSSLLDDMQKKGSSNVRTIVNNLGQKKRKMMEGDTDYGLNLLSNESRKKPKKATKAPQNNLADSEGGDHHFSASHQHEEEDDFYKQVEASEKQKKKTKKENKEKALAQMKKPSKEFEETEGRRTISRTIDENRGLVRSRPKDKKTPHSRLRSKFEGAEKKTHSKKVDKNKPYSGEAVIRTHVTHSRPLK